VVERASYAKPLHLPARQAHTAFTDDLLVAHGQFADEAVSIAEFCDLHDPPPIGILVAAGDVVRDGAREEQVILHDITDLGTVVLLVH